MGARARIENIGTMSDADAARLHWMPQSGQDTHAGGRCKGKRNSVWVWMAVMEGRDGGRWMDFEVGGRDESAFLRLLGRMPDAERYKSDGCKV